MFSPIELASLCVCILLAASSSVLATPTPAHPTLSPIDFLSGGYGLHAQPAPSRRHWSSSQNLGFGSDGAMRGIGHPTARDPYSSVSAAELPFLRFGEGATGGKNRLPVVMNPALTNIDSLVQLRHDGLHGLTSNGYAGAGVRPEFPSREDNHIAGLGFGASGAAIGARGEPVPVSVSGSSADLRRRDSDSWENLQFGNSADFGRRHHMSAHMPAGAGLQRRWSWYSDPRVVNSLRFGGGANYVVLSKGPSTQERRGSLGLAYPSLQFGMAGSTDGISGVNWEGM
ncbi:hypothetical protein B0H21DRAFT_64291 [Amylocystis lapponica]|nr:hypothetical protein B0H21DRAFT_64291 [Amylocystis lapponica]